VEQGLCEDFLADKACGTAEEELHFCGVGVGIGRGDKVMTAGGFWLSVDLKPGDGELERNWNLN
jgi:hypothetical protein